MKQNSLISNRSRKNTAQLMTDQVAGRAARRKLATAERSLRDAADAFGGAPRNTHTPDEQQAVQTALQKVQNALACTAAMVDGAR